MGLYTIYVSAHGLRRLVHLTRSLVIVDGLLPCPVAFHPYLHASEYHLFATSEINTQLDNISVVDWEWF